MAPEIVKRKRYSFEIDIWMLGILIFELLHGRKPWAPFEETSNGRDNAMAAGRSGESVASDMKSLEAQVNEYFSNLNEKLSKQLSANCVNLLQNLLTIDPSKRLGSSDDGWLDVMKHPWFTGIDWNKMRALEVPAPLKPNTGKGNFSEDVEYDDLFDPPIPRRIDPKDQELFLDFEYHTKIFDPSVFTKKLSSKGRGRQGGGGVQGSTENKFAPGQQLELETEGLVDSASFIDGVNTPSTLSPSTSFVKGDLGSIRFGQESPSNAFS